MKLWIVRNRFGDLLLYDNKPKVNKVTCEITSIGGFYNINNNLFPEVIFENSPQQVELKLVDKV